MPSQLEMLKLPQGYEQRVIKCAKDHKFISEEAIACEQENQSGAKKHLEWYRDAYARCGAQNMADDVQSLIDESFM